MTNLPIRKFEQDTTAATLKSKLPCREWTYSKVDRRVRKKFDSNWLIFQKRSEVIPGGQQEKNPVKMLSYSNLQILYLSYMSKIRMPYGNKSMRIVVQTGENLAVWWGN